MVSVSLAVQSFSNEATQVDFTRKDDVMWIEVNCKGKSPRCQKCKGRLLITSVDIAQPDEVYIYYSCEKCKEPHGVYHSGGTLFHFKEGKK